ncbi:MAG TPA: pseudouridine synthase [Actinomycetota bacterium]|nr:pseudouridine synthase [Actinomycetota bacterium]
MAERLQKALARAGFGSRRACEELIRAGRVRLNGRVATLGDRVDPVRDMVEVDGSRVNLDPDLRFYALNKPRGVVSTVRDPQGRPDLRPLLPPGPRVFPVGRLDRDSEGLLLLTNDGELANRLLHPRHGVEKEYLAEVEGEPGEADVRALVRGVRLDDGPARALAARVVGRRRGRAALRIVMGEGRKREVRRMLDALGFPVLRLVRLRVGDVRLGRLRPGETRELSPQEVRALYRSAGL